MYELLQARFAQAVVDVPNFPKPGVVFKDLAGLWGDPQLSKEVVAFLVQEAMHWNVEAVAGIESRGFLLGMPLAMALDVPFILVRKAGKLPGKVLQQGYALEYGESVLEVQADLLHPGQRILVHDDVLATGGTAEACAELFKRAGAEVVGWSFLLELSFVLGRQRLGSGGSFARPLLSVE